MPHEPGFGAIDHLLGAVGADTRGWAEVAQQFTVPQWALCEWKTRR
jgi:hypothetical protein